MTSVFGPEVVEGFVKSWGMICASEIGDKTFFIAAVMAMRSSRLTVYTGALSALALMTALSAFMGWAAPNLISKAYTHYAAIALFLFFGLRMLWDSYHHEAQGSNAELEEVERELAASRNSHSTAHKGSNGTANGTAKGDADSLKGKQGLLESLLGGLVSPVLIEAFVLTFLAEWGDRSQIATIGLAASIDAVGVTLGGILGHAICTGVAVVGGRKLANHINERSVMIFGGLLFLAFGAHAALEGVDG